MAHGDPEYQNRILKRYSRLEEQFHLLGGWAAEAEAGSIASSLGLPDRVLLQPLGTLSGGQRRRVELARVLFSGAPTLILDEPTNHLDADSIAWLRNFLRAHDGGLMVISHDGELLDSVVNKVFHLDATRGQLDVYRLGWKAYLAQLATDERRRTARAQQRRAQGGRAQGPGRPYAGEGDQGEDGPQPRSPGRAPHRRARGGPPGRTGWPSCASRRLRRAAGHRSALAGSPSPTGLWRCSPGSTWPSTAAVASSSSG